MNFLEKLECSAEKNNSIVCFGMDFVEEHVPGEPSHYRGERFTNYAKHLVWCMQERNVLPGAFKLNQGFYDVLNEPHNVNNRCEGSRSLAMIIEFLHRELPDTPVILDSKRGDIGTSARNYARSIFDGWRADACTANPYMGSDSVGEFAQFAGDKGKGVYVLCRTSNPSAKEFQELSIYNYTVEGIGAAVHPLHRETAMAIARWAEQAPGVGAVFGATAPKELANTAAYFAPDQIPLLLPGVGSQGGSASEVVQALRSRDYPLHLARINSSSGLTHGWVKRKQPMPKDPVNYCVDRLEELNTQIGYRSAV